MVDFLIVGRGLAATVLAHTFHTRGISFRIVGAKHLSTCSQVAAGIWNPVVFKRLTKSWLAEDLLPCLNEFYLECGRRLGKKIITHRPLIKPFTEEQEKKLWLKKADAELRLFLDKTIHAQPEEELRHLQTDNGYGIVNACGNLDVPGFLEVSSAYFNEFISDEVFDHGQLHQSAEKLVYKTHEARHIIFCEGFLVKDNPLFNWVPLKPAKGEILTVSVPGLALENKIFNRNGFLMDISEAIYKVGATYAWDDLSQEPTGKGREELESKLRHMTGCTYSVVAHQAGIRPSSSDRRPVIGSHPLYHNVHVFNGLGTKGVMLAPYFAKNFVNFYLQKETLNKETDVRRFYHLYDKNN